MVLAHHFPGLNIDVERLGAMTPEETSVIVEEANKVLKDEAEERWAHTKIIVQACGARVGL